MRKKNLLFMTVCVLCLGGSAMAGMVHDLSDDWTSSSNPTASGWMYTIGGVGSDTTGVAWGDYSSGDFSGSEQGWRDTSVGWDHVGWCKIASAPHSGFELEDGDVITHSAGNYTSVVWTADATTAATYLLDVSAWRVRSDTAGQRIYIYLNDSDLLFDSGEFTNSSYTRAAPKVVANSYEITLNEGDAIRLVHQGNEYQNISMTLTEVPEPVTIALLACGGMAVIVRRRK